MTIRVVQWTTGNVGRQSVEAVMKRPDLELVGCYAWSEEKSGKDIGELCGLAPIGLTATSDIDALLSDGHPQAQVVAVAPISGLVVDRQIGQGQFLTAGSATAVYTIADLSTVWLVANVREAQASHVQVGQAVAVHVLAVPDREFDARLSYVAASVDPASRRLTVHAVLDNSEHLLKPEMFASFTIATSTDSIAPAVPQDAVIFEGSQARVWVMQGTNDAAVRQVSLGRAHRGNYEVLQGLKSGDRVVTRGALFIDRAASGG